MANVKDFVKGTKKIALREAFNVVDALTNAGVQLPGNNQPVRDPVR